MNKNINIFYKFIMPAITIILLLGVSPFISKPITAFGIFVRVILCFWFCAWYISLPNLSKHSYFPNTIWTKSDVGPKEKYFYIGVGIFLGTGCAIITGWTLQTFIPIFGDFYIVIAILNGFIIMVPIVYQYWALKL